MPRSSIKDYGVQCFDLLQLVEQSWGNTVVDTVFQVEEFFNTVFLVVFVFVAFFFLFFGDSFDTFVEVVVEWLTGGSVNTFLLQGVQWVNEFVFVFIFVVFVFVIFVFIFGFSFWFFGRFFFLLFFNFFFF